MNLWISIAQFDIGFGSQCTELWWKHRLSENKSDSRWSSLFEVSRLKYADENQPLYLKVQTWYLWLTSSTSLCLLHYSQLGLLHFQVCNLLSLFFLPPSVLHKNPHNLHQLLSFGLCHMLFPFLLSYLKCFPLQLFFSVYLVLFLSTCPLLLYVPSLFFKLNVSFHGVAPESRWRVGLLTVLEVKTRPLCGLIMGQTGWRRVKDTHVHTRMQTHVVALFKLVWSR